MSDREKDDGLIVGIILSLLLLLAIGFGVGGFLFVRTARLREMEARAAAERAIFAEEQARAAAELMRTQAEAVRAESEAVLNAATSQEGEAPPSDAAETDAQVR